MHTHPAPVKLAATPGVIHAAVVTASVDSEHRTIEGVATFFGEAANASTGRVQFEPDSLHLPDDLKRVKLCLDHDHSSAVGYCVEASMDAHQLRMKFYVPESEAGDAALASAAAGLRDGLSVGAYPNPGGAKYLHGSGTLVITNAVVREVSLTALPAFDAARVETVKASSPEEGNTTMSQTTTATEATATEATATTVEATTVPVVTQAPPVVTAHKGPNTVEAAARMAVQLIGEGASMGAVLAALNDVVPADDAGTGFIGRAEWLGKLWEARRTDRPFIDSITRKPLGRTTKVKGWAWEARPQVGPYIGNKTAVPSNAVKTKLVERDVERTAGGWDIDRIFLDLGDPDMIQAMWEGALEDYLTKTEAKVAAYLATQATAVTATGGVPDALAALGAAAAQVGANVSFVGMGADMWAEFTQLTHDEVPWWMTQGDSLNLSTAAGTVNGMRLFMDPTISPTSLLAGDSRAATFYEATPPVRVNAVNVPNGGVDLGLFGYHGTIINDARALLKVETAGTGA